MQGADRTRLAGAQCNDDQHRQHRQNSTKSGEENVVGVLLMCAMRCMIRRYVQLPGVKATCKSGTCAQHVPAFFVENVTQVGLKL
jgi:hypothetical protein